MRYIVVPIHALTEAPVPAEPSPAPGTPGEPPAAAAEPAEPAVAVAAADPAPSAPSAPGGRIVAPDDALAQWVAAARTSLDACVVVDAGGTVAALSSPAAELLGTAAAALIGRSLDEALNLVDFSDTAREASGAARRIPPLIAVRENSLSRGMMRVRRPDGGRLMLDAVAAPIHDTERRPIGAVSFLASV